VIVGFRYVFDKKYGRSLCVSKNIYKMFGGSVILVAFQSVFLISAHQNDQKTQKIYQLEAKKK
jgi:hypothetical protein